MTLLFCGASQLIHAQVTYSVFPAVPQELPATTQPTSRTLSLVSLNVKDSTIGYVARALVDQANLHLSYDDVNPLFKNRVTVHVEKANLMDALAFVLRGTGLTARLATDGETVLIHPLPQSHGGVAQPTGGTISGRVTDSASGAGLGGASVRVEGTKLTAITSDSGNFKLLNVPSGNQVLTVRLFGYKPADRAVTVVDSERTTVRIVLVSVPTVLSGVVTTATGQQQRYQVGNDITVLNADSIQQIAPVSTLTDMLETRVPGLIVQRTSGIPGAPSRLRIRGITSVNSSSDPILIVDGVRVYADQSGNTNPQSYNSSNSQPQMTSGGGSSITSQSSGISYAGPSALDQIDPNSIETIEVLKGPSATAIYGSDAAAGVIVITTKHGRAGPTRWDLTLNAARTTEPGSWPINYYRFGHNLGSNASSILSVIGNGDLEGTGSFQNFITDSIVAFQALNDPRYSPLTGQPGANHGVDLTVTGGSGAITYSVTGSASSQSGYLHLPEIEVQRFETVHGFGAPGWMRDPDAYTTYGENSALTVQLLGKGGGTLSLTEALFKSSQQQSSLQGDLAQLASMYVDTTQLATTPLFENYYERAQLATTTFRPTIALQNWAPWHLLPINATAGLSLSDQNNTALLPRDYVICAQYGNSSTAICSDSLGSYSLGQGTNTSLSLTAGTTLSQRWVTTALGFNVYTIDQSSFSASTKGLPIGVTTPTELIPFGQSYPTVTSYNTATYGWYVQPTLNFHSRFFVSPGFRLDGGSNAGAHASSSTGNLTLFPKIDFSWLAVNRSPSTPLFGALTVLRPRIAFGIAGVQPGPAETLRLLTPVEATTPSTTTPTDILTVSTLGNPNLQPEKDEEFEGGVDAQFWNQRLSLDLTGYSKMAYNAILAVPVAPSVLAPGTSSDINENIGNIRNVGLEMTLGLRPVDNRFISWSVDVSASTNHNKLVSLANGVNALSIQSGIGYSTRITPGYPVDGFWAQPIIGFYDQNPNSGNNLALMQQDWAVNGDGVVILGDSAKYVGEQQPNYESDISSTISLLNGRISINTAFDYQNGLTQIAPNTSPTILNNPATPIAEIAAYAALYPINGDPSAIGVMQTVNLLRWQSLSVTYVIPTHLAHLFQTRSMSVSLQGSNLGLHTNYRGKDPNVNAYSNGNLTLDDGNELPQPRTWNLRFNMEL